MNRDLIPKYTLRGESYIDFHGLGYKTYIFSFKAEEILNTVSLNHLYELQHRIGGLESSPSVIQKLYEIHKQGEFINAL